MLNSRVLLFCFTVLIILIISDFTDARENIYYILQWGRKKVPKHFIFKTPGQKFFTDYKCKYKNCYVTNNKTYFKDQRLFDEIIFDIYELRNVHKKRNLPSGPFRSNKQKYIFMSHESEILFPLCYPFLNNFFNWTWTHRLDSDFRRGYITIYDKAGEIVGPRVDQTWNKYWKPINKKLKEKLMYKTELAAWFVSNCHSKDKRRLFVNQVQKALKKLGGQPVDIFGACGRYDCPRGSSKCPRMLQRDYFFYLAFENSFSRDYVTEKLMTALDHYTVPVVYGGADYDRFLPPGSYLNARELGPENLARKMLAISANASAYYDFFRWRNHYVYKDTTNSDSCKLCERMNNAKSMKKKQTKRAFVKWWNNDLCSQ